MTITPAENEKLTSAIQSIADRAQEKNEKKLEPQHSPLSSPWISRLWVDYLLTNKSGGVMSSIEQQSGLADKTRPAYKEVSQARAAEVVAGADQSYDKALAGKEAEQAQKAKLESLKSQLKLTSKLSGEAATVQLRAVATEILPIVELALANGLTDKNNAFASLKAIATGTSQFDQGKQWQILDGAVSILQKDIVTRGGVLKTAGILGAVALVLEGIAYFTADNKDNGKVDFSLTPAEQLEVNVLQLQELYQTGRISLDRAYKLYIQRAGEVGVDPTQVMTPEEFEERMTSTPKPAATNRPEATPAGLKLPEAPRMWSETARNNSLLRLTEANRKDVFAAYAKAFPELVRQFDGDVEKFADRAGFKIFAYDPTVRMFVDENGVMLSPTLGKNSGDDEKKALQEIDRVNPIARSVIDGGTLGKIIFPQPIEELRGTKARVGFNENIYQDAKWQKAFMANLKAAFEKIKPGSWKDGRTFIVQMTPDDLTNGAPVDRNSTGGGVRPFYAGTDAFGKTLVDENTMFVRFSMDSKRLQDDLEDPKGSANYTSIELIYALAYAHDLVNPANAIEIGQEHFANLNYDVAVQAGPIESLIKVYKD